VSAQFLVLLLAFVVEDKNLRAAALADDFADDTRIRLVADLTFFARNRHHWKLNLTIGPVQFLDSNHIAGRHPVLLSTGADNRVHTSASVKCRVKSARERHVKTTLQCRSPKAHTSAARGPADFLCLLCFRPGASAAKAGVPRTGRRVQSNLIILSCVVEIGQTKEDHRYYSVREIDDLRLIQR